jgi:tetratricopeptide (TPR) repeat protein
MDDKIKFALIERIVSLGKERALEVAWSIIDYFKVDLKGTEYIDELLEIGMDYDRFGEPDKALAMYFKAEKRALAIGDNYGLGTIYSNIGVVYNNTKDYNKALEYYEKSLKLILEVNNEQELGILYNNLGYVNKNILKYIESIDYYHKSLKYLKKVNDKFSLTASYYNLAEVYAKLHEYEGALQYIEECIKLDQELNLSTLKDDIKFRESLKAKYAHHLGQSAEVKKQAEAPKIEKSGWFGRRKKS